MKNKSHLLLAVFIAIFLGSVLHVFMKFYIFRDYPIYAEIDCDPAVEMCFVYECDPETEECTGNPEEDTFYYKMITKNASNIEVCDPNQDECPPLQCQPNEEGCEENLCTEELAEEQEVYCSSPEDFVEEEAEGTEEEEMQELEEDAGSTEEAEGS